MDKKRIIFIMTDTQRQDMLGCYGDSEMKTPHLDRLASEGVTFTKAYTCQPVCGPARSAIFTGMYPHSNGSWSNSMPLYANVKTIGQRLHDHGIETAYIGKWHLDGGDYFGTGQCPEGWNENYWYDMRRYLYEMNIEDRVKSRMLKTMHENGGIKPEFTYAHKCTNKAIDFLKNYTDDEFFLTVSYDEPHGPCLCPEPYASMYKGFKFKKSPNCYDTLENKPAYQKLWAGKTLEADKDSLEIFAIEEFMGCNSYVDSEIGRLLEAIDTYAEDALVIYTSDHGDMLLSHSIDSKANAVYEEITKIPFIVRGKSVPAGVTSDLPISHIGLTPTFLEYMGLDSPDPIQGKSLLEVFEKPAETTFNEPVFMEFGRFEVIHDGVGGLQLMRGVYDGRYKMAIHLLDSDELYDLENDPYEMNNLINDPEYSEIRNKLHDLILNMMNMTRDPFRGYQWGKRAFRPNFSYPRGDWANDGKSRQINNVGYEPNQLEYWSALEFLEKHQDNFLTDPERLRKMTEEQKFREAKN